jgi:formylglycine-generating enzyme required for sulfatase activity
MIKMTSLIKRLSFLIIVLSVIACNDATQSNLNSNDGGSIRFSVNWIGPPTEQDTNEYHARALDCDVAGIETVSFEVMDESDDQLAYATFNCSLHQGKVDNVSPGTNRTLIVRGLDSESNEAYRGTVTGITVVLGEEEDVGEVEALPCQTWYQDSDSDTYGDPSDSLMICPQPVGYVSNNTDCDDTDGKIHPGATEDCSNGDDEDCDGDIDCDDSDCSDDIYCEIPAEICGDGRDNDGDGGVDCNDSDCAAECPGSGYYTNNQDMTFKLIPAGSFTMGSPVDELGHEIDENEHQVTLTQAFYMQTTEVTQGQWEAVMGSNPSNFISCGDDCPVETISWDDVQIFLAALNSLGEGIYRLPTEAEWEYAARAGSITAYANGDITVTDCSHDPNLDVMGWYCYNASETTQPVAHKDANAWGLYDMHGNVWEWVNDWYGDYPSGSISDPRGPANGSQKVNRGGSWGTGAGFCRFANRRERGTGDKGSSLGFRLVYEPLFTNSLGMTFNKIQPGTFTMGSPDGVSEHPIGSGEIPAAELGRVNDETPHQVTITKSFYMQSTEVTQEQWAAVMGNNPSYYPSCGNNCPVENVSWNDIQIFIAVLNNMGEGYYRIPTEAEWEYVARAGSNTALTNGEISVEFCEYDPNLNNVGWYCNNAGSTPHLVAQKQANAWGIFDMHGNVWEWVQDWYGDYPTVSVTDPTGPASGSERVERGGSIFSDARRCRSAVRSTFAPDTRRGYLGFRLVYKPSYTNSVGMTFNLIPAGTFTMGSPDGVSEYPIGSGEIPVAELSRDDNEIPHQVTLTQSYYLQTTEVTQGQWKSVMGSNPSYFISCGDDCPVENVSWEDTQTFLSTLNSMVEGFYRLPSEAEWEYAAKAGSTTALANGDITVPDTCDYDSVMDLIGWYCYNANSSTNPVAQKQANTWGLYDMHGNVFEWCQDWYADYPTNHVYDPTGPTGGTHRIRRGGSWLFKPGDCRSADRNYLAPDLRAGDNGFRLVYEQPYTNSMALIPSGCFDMGDAFGEGSSDELPVHNICITSDFYMDVHEVTNAGYAACVGAGSCTVPSISSSRTRASYYGNPDYDSFPVIYISWSQANDYCTWAEKRLPTEAEWEYAARGGLSGKRYPWGDTISGTEANYDHSGDDPWNDDTSPVAFYPANGYGLYDMAGNVSEWVNDWYQSDYYNMSPTNDPPGPDSGTYGVTRGGNYYSNSYYTRVADRNQLEHTDQWRTLGFRCVLDTF